MLRRVCFQPQRRTSRVPALSVQPGSAPAGAKCNPRLLAGQRVQRFAKDASDLLHCVPIAHEVTLVRAFFSFSIWSDKYAFINDYKVLKADVAKLLAQIEQSYV